MSIERHTSRPPDRPTVGVHGYCAQSPPAILDTFASRGPEALIDLGGDYVLVIECDGQTCLISSTYGVQNYFYSADNGRFVHADTVFGVLRKASLPWKWDYTSLGDVTHLEHCIDGRTLHPAISRLTPATVVRYENGKLTIQRKSWEDLHPNAPVDPGAAVDALNAETARWLDSTATISMSGGFDSRLLLSSALRAGVRPKLVTMGPAEATDVQISRDIAAHSGLELLRVEPTSADYLEQGGRIAELTGGSKPAQNWHTYIYMRKLGLPRETRLLIGSNGEFARSYFLDKGILSRLADTIAPGAALGKFWDLKLKAVFKECELAGFCPELAAQFRPAGRQARLERLVALCPGGLMRGLDRFYAQTRVSNFIANGVKLVGDSVRPIMPMVSSAWGRVVWNLPRGWKMDSRWHRFAIAANSPELLDFPEERRGPRMKAGRTWLYWLPRRNRVPVRPLVDYAALFRSPEILSYMRDNADSTSDLMEAPVVKSICDEHERTGGRMRTMSLLLSWMMWGKWQQGHLL